MRFLGNIATPKLDASPIKTIESLWGGEMPVFDNNEAVNELFGTMMNLWNELTKHQSGVKPVRLARMPAKTDGEGLRLFCQTRSEELEGFIDGLFGDEETIDLPERASEALNHLTDINAMLHGILDLLAREPTPLAAEEDTAKTLEGVVKISRIAEKELHAVVLSCTQARRQAISSIAVDKQTIH